MFQVVNINFSIIGFISTVFFDELGLAELSPNNPLKVLNSELEYYDKNKEKVAFIGISNWVLDSSKMNRGIFITILDMKEKDLINTASIISQSYSKDLSTKYHDFIK